MATRVPRHRLLDVATNREPRDHAELAGRDELERHILDRQPEPKEFLLYPEKTGPEFYGGPIGVIWQDRRKQLSSTAMHRWWVKCEDRAGLQHRPMHEARHTAITDFLRQTGNLKLAQMLAGQCRYRHHREHLRPP